MAERFSGHFDAAQMTVTLEGNGGESIQVSDTPIAETVHYYSCASFLHPLLYRHQLGLEQRVWPLTNLVNFIFRVATQDLGQTEFGRRFVATGTNPQFTQDLFSENIQNLLIKAAAKTRVTLSIMGCGEPRLRLIFSPHSGQMADYELLIELTRLLQQRIVELAHAAKR